MHYYIMYIKNRFLSFVRSTAGHDAIIAGVVMFLTLSCSTLFIVIPTVYGPDASMQSVCNGSTTVFTTFAADRPC